MAKDKEVAEPEGPRGDLQGEEGQGDPNVQEQAALSNPVPEDMPDGEDGEVIEREITDKISTADDV